MNRMTFARRDWWLWFGCALGPVAWFALLVIGWQTVPGAHEYGRVATLRAMAAGAAVFPIVGAIIAVREIKLAGGDQEETKLQRRRFFGITAFSSSMLFLLLIIATAVPMVMLPPGAEP
jgi:hypothetical protein